MIHSKRGLPKLQGLLEAETILRGVYKKSEYFAKVDKEGRICIGDHVFNSPTTASVYIRQQNYDGWLFWQYKDKHSNWIFISSLRKKKV